MFIKPPSIHKGNSSRLGKELTSGSKALVVLKTVPRNVTGTLWLLLGGAREAGVTVGARWL